MTDPHACDLCGTRVPRVLRRKQGKASRYCCSGCQHVSEILAVVPPEQGQKIMEQARRLGIIPEPQSQPTEAVSDRPDPAPPPREAIRAERFLVEGYACPSCAWLIGAVLLQEQGVLSAEADFLSDSLRVTFDMRRTAPSDIAQAIRPFGYDLHPLREGDAPEEVLFSRLLKRFVFALFLALNVMMLSAVHWASYLEVIPPVDLLAIAAIQLVLTLPLIAVGVWPLLKRALKLMRLGKPSMDLLFVMGFLAALGLSVAAFFVPDSHFYFDTCGAFVAISLFGRLVEGKLRLRAARELRAILEVSATKVAVVEGNGLPVFRPIEQIEPGAVIRIDPGHYVPFDGACTGGACVSEAMLTGEPAPLIKQPGDDIWAGSRVEGEALELRVTRPFHEGRLQQIADGIAAALTRQELRLRSADRVAAWFVPGVLAVAGVTFALRMALAGVTDWLSSDAWMPVISVLLVACPCAFGIATASALAVAVSALLSRGVLVKDGGALERFGGTDLLVFDKTGTLTTGVWRLVEIRWLGEEQPDLLLAVAGAERGIEHPVAHTLRAHLLAGDGAEPDPPDQVEPVPGKGLRARFGDRELRLGSAALFEVRPDLVDVDDRTTVVFFGFDGAPAGAFLLTDAIRAEAADVVAWFGNRNVDSAILSGDRQQVVDGVAKRLGIRVAQGGMSPEDKRDRVAAMEAGGRRVAFAGDGSNDSLAMAVSEVAVSLRHGTNLALSAAHILPLTGDLSALPPLHTSARLTHRTMWQNFGWAFVYNAVFLPLAALGYLHPIFAAVLMFASSTTVLVNSMRLRPRIERIWSKDS